MKVYLTKRGGGFWPADQEATDVARGYKHGALVQVDLKRARNPMHHRKGMALMRLLFENQDREANFDRFRTELKIRIGAYDEFITAAGELVYVPLKLDFASMDQDTFATRIYRPLTQLALTDYFPPGATEAQVEAEVMRRIRF